MRIFSGACCVACGDIHFFGLFCWISDYSPVRTVLRLHNASVLHQNRYHMLSAYRVGRCMQCPSMIPRRINTLRLAMVHSMAGLDSKQKRLITSWLGLADRPGMEPYTQFMALWIAFNAYCYPHYGESADRPRADLKKDTGFANVSDEPQRVDAHIHRDQRRIIIDLDAPTTIRIHITERYTEDNIYASFAQHHASTYKALWDNNTFAKAVEQFQHAIAKNGRHYVINMLKANQHRAERTFREMANDHTIVPFEDTQSLRQLKDVLYQVRCNIFHGEKVPGEPNDDRIVTAAVPVLRQLIHALTKQEIQQ